MAKNQHTYTLDSIEKKIGELLYSSVVYGMDSSFGLEAKLKPKLVLGGWFYKAKSSSAPFKKKKNTEAAFFELEDKFSRVIHSDKITKKPLGEKKRRNSVLSRSRITAPIPYKEIQYVIVRVLYDPYTAFIHIEGKKSSLILTPEESADTDLVCRFVAALKFRINDYDSSLLLRKTKAIEAATKVQTLARMIAAKKRADRIRERRANLLNPALKLIGIDEETDVQDAIRTASMRISDVSKTVSKGITSGGKLGAALASDFVNLRQNPENQS